MTDDRFVREARADVRRLSDGLVALEASPDRETVDDLFRTAHNLKGTFGMEGYGEASDLAHALEDVLDAVRSGRVDPDSAVTDHALRATDSLGTMLDEIARDGHVETDPEPVIDTLRAVSDGPPTDSDSPADGAAPGEPPRAEGDSPADDPEPGAFVPDESVEAALDAASEFDDLDALAADIEEPDIDLEDVQGGGSMDDLFDDAEDDSLDDEFDGDISGEAFLEESLSEHDTPAAEDAPTDGATERGSAEETPASDSPGDGLTDVDPSELDLSGAEPSGESLFGDDSGTDSLNEAAETDDSTDGDDADEVGADDDGDAPVDDEAPASADADALGTDGASDGEPTASGDETDDAESGVAEMFSGADTPETDPFATDDDGVADAPESDSGSVSDLFDSDDDGESGPTDAESADAPAETESEPADEAAPSAGDDESIGSEIDFIWAKQSVEDEDTSVDELQSEIEAESFGEFDDDDDMSIQELIDMEADGADEDAASPADADADATDFDTVDAHGETAAEGEVAEGPSADETGVPGALDGETAAADSTDGMEAADGVEASDGSAAETGDSADAFDSADTAATADAPDVDDGFDTESVEDLLDEAEEMDDAADTDEPAEAADDADTTSVVDVLEQQASEMAAADEDPLDSEVEADLDTDILDDPLDEQGEAATDAADDIAFTSDSTLDEFEERFEGMFESSEGAAAGPTGAAETIAESSLPAGRFRTADDERGRSLARDATDLQSLTVEAEHADELLSVAERLSRHVRQLSREVESPEAEDTVSSLDAVARNLQRTVMGIRLMPLRRVTDRLPRVVRDVARETDTDAEVTVDGADIQLDRGVIERIGDPLVHLVRNAVDHGIEPPAEREAAGKPPTGQVEVRAAREGDDVTIEVEDDGGGIDPDDVREAAVAEGIVTDDEAADRSDSAAFDLLFHPGLSTREEVTETSGRGVGMDVVSETVTGLSGSVEVESAVGEGTLVRLRIPVSVAVAEVLFVEAGNQRFALPTAAVEHIGPAAGARVTDGGLLETAATTDRTMELATTLGGSEMPAGDDAAVVHVDTGDELIELRCSDVLERREVVITPYDDLLADVPELSGATTGSDGALIHVLDTTEL